MFNAGVSPTAFLLNSMFKYLSDNCAEDRQGVFFRKLGVRSISPPKASTQRKMAERNAELRRRWFLAELRKWQNE